MASVKATKGVKVTPTKSKTTARPKVKQKPTATVIKRKVVSRKSPSVDPRFEKAVEDGKKVAIDRVQAIIEFEIDGTIIKANENFLNATGYSLEEIEGEHHSMFVDPAYAQSQEYRTFWEKLRKGDFMAGEFRRITKSGANIWLNASYNPIFDARGKVIRVVKYATDITATKQRNADYEGQLIAINKSQAIIEFNLDGSIVHANDNFCSALGYSLDEIKGKHHRIFCESNYTSGHEYREFWDNLRQGTFQSGQFKRIARGGKEIWIQATYNPINDLSGKPFKVVKYATDITAQKLLEFAVAEKQRSDELLALEQKEKVATLLGCVNALADGDFTKNIPDLGSDAVGQVASALRAAGSSIRKTLTEVADVSGTVATAAEQLNSASREISSGAQTQASSLEETASSLEEITSTIKQNSDNAQQARQLANGSRDIAEKGGAVVSEAVAAMAEINQSSKKIADIITTIDEIAFQTNLLALNAAVEAARAGEQGRGFAVVAAEVRNLAQRSASAAKEIKNLIQDSVHRVENGTHLVNRSGETLNEIVNSVKRVTDIVAEIAAASKEQLVGVEQVNKAVSQMDRVTQGNASQTEEVSATASALLSNAEQLQEQIGRFQLGIHSSPAKHSQRRESFDDRSHRKLSVQQNKDIDRRADFEFDRASKGVSELMEF